jgi:UDP-N-acetylmuramoyl-tripeptide--D-alanyl-D-alanine ligase
MALEVLKAFEGNKKIIITPGMIELGEMEASLNQTFGEQIAAVCDAVILVGISRTKPIWEGLKKQGFPEHQIYRVKSIHEAYAQLGAIVAIGDVVLIENDLPDSFNEAL